MPSSWIHVVMQNWEIQMLKQDRSIQQQLYPQALIMSTRPLLYWFVQHHKKLKQWKLLAEFFWWGQKYWHILQVHNNWFLEYFWMPRYQISSLWYTDNLIFQMMQVKDWQKLLHFSTNWAGWNIYNSEKHMQA